MVQSRIRNNMQIHRPPFQIGEAGVGRTLPSLLDEACTERPNKHALWQRRIGSGPWESLSTAEFRARSSALAASLLASGLVPGDRVAMWMRSDVDFCIVDMACMSAGLVTVPLILGSDTTHVQRCIERTGARVLFVNTATQAERIDRSTLERIIATDAGGLAAETGARAESELPAVEPSDLATILFTSGTGGEPRGVRLTHENLASNAISSFTGLSRRLRGSRVVALSFLPMAHAFERVIHYGYIHAGHTVYFTTPDRLGEDMRALQPTEFTAVPRVLERIFENILARGAELTGWRHRLFESAMRFATAFPDEGTRTVATRLRHAIFDRLIYKRWRAATGGRLEFVVCGGAPLRAEIVRAFGAAGIRILHGYGLSEASPIVSFNRIERGRAGSVGIPLAGVDVGTATDGEVHVRGPNIMAGYHDDPIGTDAVLREGWLATGDLGHLDDDGFLWITGRKKDLLRLSTGRDVSPSAFEREATAEPGIAHAVVVGAGRKHCAALLFPDAERLAQLGGSPPDLDALCETAAATRAAASAIERGNAALPDWARITRWQLVPHELSVEDELLTQTMKVRRDAVCARFAASVRDLYEDDQPDAVP